LKPGKSRRPKEAEPIAKETVSTNTEPERAVLVAVELKKRDHLWSIEDTLSELGYLARTAGAQVVGELYQRADRYTATWSGIASRATWSGIASSSGSQPFLSYRGMTWLSAPANIVPTAYTG